MLSELSSSPSINRIDTLSGILRGYRHNNYKYNSFINIKYKYNSFINNKYKYNSFINTFPLFVHDC